MILAKLTYNLAKFSYHIAKRHLRHARLCECRLHTIELLEQDADLVLVTLLVARFVFVLNASAMAPAKLLVIPDADLEYEVDPAVYHCVTLPWLVVIEIYAVRFGGLRIDHKNTVLQVFPVKRACATLPHVRRA